MKNKKQYIIISAVIISISLFNPSQGKSEADTSILFAVKTENGSGYIDIHGKTIIPFKYRTASRFLDNMARVSNGRNYGYINKKGKLVIPMEYAFAGHFNEGYAMVRKNGRYGLIDKNNNTIIPFIYHASTGSFSEGLAGFKKDGKWAYFNIRHEKVIPYMKGFTASSFNEGIASIGTSGKYGAINKQGKLILPRKFDSGPQCHNGRIRARLNRKYGYYDKNGNLIIPHKYRWGNRFSEGLAFVGTGRFKSGQNGLINTSGKFVHVFTLRTPYVATYFSDGLINVRNLRKNAPNNSSFMDKNGNIILSGKFWGLGQAFNKGYVLFTMTKGGDSWGVMDRKGNVIIPEKYNFISW